MVYSLSTGTGNGRSNQEEVKFLVYDWLSDCQLYDTHYT